MAAAHSASFYPLPNTFPYEALMTRFRTVLPALVALLITAGCVTGCGPETERATSTASPDTGQSAVDILVPSSSDPDVPYVPTPQRVVDRMLEVADVSENDVLYDLGSGDGRIPIRAAQQYGARGVGIEIDSALVRKARRNAEEAGVADRVRFRQADLFEIDISEATVVTLYLLPSVNLRLRPKLFEELAPGTRVVSHDFDMDEWEPEERIEVGNDVIFFWTIPEEVPANLQQDAQSGQN
jgi:SAM-dependent methyltransferase